MNEKRKFLSLFSLFLVLVTILAIMLGLSNSHDFTSARYIKREKDEVRAYYSSLYFDATGEGSGITLENNVGYVTLDLKNYIGENVTKRDIEYQIKTIDKYYDQNGNLIVDQNGDAITDPAALDGKNLYVLDLWNQPKKIENNTCKYNVNVESNSGEEILDKHGNKNYLLRYEERGTSAVGKTHKATLKVERKSTDPIVDNEKISVVVQILKPYMTVYIINMYVTNRLILFSDMDIELFDIPFKSLQIQTANAFNYAHKVDTTDTTKTTGTTETSQPFKTSKAFRVTLSWENLMLNESMLLRTIHNNVYGLLGTTNANNIDISKPYFNIADLEQSDQLDTGSGQTVYKGRLVIYVPQSSNFNLYFLPTDKNYKINATIEICHNNTYAFYTENEFGGYADAALRPVMSSPPSEGGNVNG